MKYIEAHLANSYGFINAKLDNGYIVIGALGTQNSSTVSTGDKRKYRIYINYIAYYKIEVYPAKMKIRYLFEVYIYNKIILLTNGAFLWSAKTLSHTLGTARTLPTATPEAVGPTI